MLRKIESAIFYLFIFCVPLQVRIILVNWAPPRVGFNEWTTAFLQATDILIVALLLLWLIRWLHHDAGFKFGKADMFLGIFFVISALSVTASSFKSLSGYQLLKLAEFILFYFYIKSNLGMVFYPVRDKIPLQVSAYMPSAERISNGVKWKKLLEVLVISGAVQAVIGIVQYTTQSALGLHLLSESPITPGGEGVASFYVGSKVYLRAYGLMPHPNILASFLMVCIAAFLMLFFSHNQESRSKNQEASIEVKSFLSLILNSRFCILVYAVMLYALFATYSRTVIGLMVLAMVIFLITLILQKRGFKILFNQKVYTIAIVSLAVVLLFLGLNFHQSISRALISSSDEAVSLRIFYDKVAGQTTGRYPWFGVGVGTFVPKLMQTLSHIPTYYYQPVHNIYLLISSETGIVGISSFLVFLLLLIKNYIRKNNLKDLNKLGLLLVCLTLLAIGLFDHLLWTIQQGRIIFWLALALL